MTPIRIGHPLRRETSAVLRCCPLIVELHAGYVRVYRKGTRHHFVCVSWLAIWDLGWKLAARTQAAEIAALQKGRRKRT
jgi:hypothetical protein